MSNYIEFKDKIAFHPGYYIKELVEESGLTQEDFAKSLDTTPKNLSVLINGEQALSTEMAIKLSRMLGTSVAYWQNLQNKYDSLEAEFKLQEEHERERNVFNLIDYRYFRDNFGLPELKRQVDKQIEHVRLFLGVSTLTVFSKPDMAVSFRSTKVCMDENQVVKANIMVRLATLFALEEKAPKFDKKKFESAVRYALTLTTNHEDFYLILRKKFFEAGVILVILPNMSGSNINGATKKIGSSRLLMVNDRRLYSDTFWFTLLHEAGHIMEDDYGISFEKESGDREKKADKYAEDQLIPRVEYETFVDKDCFDIKHIIEFANRINRDPGIVLGRLQKDNLVRYDDSKVKVLKHKYKIQIKK